MLVAILTAIGAITTAVATLFIISDSVIVIINNKIKITEGGALPANDSKLFAIKSVPPDRCSASPIGINAPSKMMMDQSTAL